MEKHFTAEFKLEAAKLVIDYGYNYVNAEEAVNISHTAPAGLIICHLNVKKLVAE